MKDIKFLDIGCKWGNSFAVAGRFGFKEDQGLGIDINPKNVEEGIRRGKNIVLGDATNLDMKDGSVDLVILNHILEHLPSVDMYKKAISEALRVSRKWVFIATPIFDHEDYLNSLGLKTFYSDWKGHTSMVHLKDLQEYVKDYKHTVKMVNLLKNSNAPEIHPISSPPDQHEYDASVHPSKSFIEFDRKIFREFELIIEK